MQVNISLDTSKPQDLAELRHLAESMAAGPFTNKTGEALKEILPPADKTPKADKSKDVKKEALKQPEEKAGAGAEETKDLVDATNTAGAGDFAGEAGLEKIRLVCKLKKSKDVQAIFAKYETINLSGIAEDQRAAAYEDFKALANK